MCGIAGFWGSSSHGWDSLQIAQSMARVLHHRGPDGEGVWVDPDGGPVLAHRRLAVLDLSSAGHQPMVSATGRYVISYNGEVYNHRRLRSALGRGGEAAPSSRGHSDTEVVLEAIEAWGLRSAVERFVGMFAFALWDRQARTLHLVRDRVGIKPLYYGWLGEDFVFGSELKAIVEHPLFRPEVDRDSLALLLRYNYIPAPHCIWRGLLKLTPGTFLSLDAPSARTTWPVPYWSAEEVAHRGMDDPFTGTDAEAISAVDGLLRKAVSLRMMADVPVGAFLSGGVDSSLVAALMQRQSIERIRTFSLGSPEVDYDEARYARAVAAHLRTDHTEFYVTGEQAAAVIPDLPSLYDEPFSDSSQIPTFLISKLARKQVTVALTGDGADELFAGYNRHLWAPRIWARSRRIPRVLRLAAARGLGAVPPSVWSRLYRGSAAHLPRVLRHRIPDYRIQRLSDVLPAESPDAMYRILVSHWMDPSRVVLGGTDPPIPTPGVLQRGPIRDFASRMMYLDLVTYLPDDILTKVDRASMGVGLEARVPFLDHRLVEFAWRIPHHLKVRGGESKWILRQVLDRYVPRTLVDRPKTGFGFSLDSWLRGPLRDWAEALLDEKRMREEGFFDPIPIRQKWTEHLSGRRQWHYQIWDILMFQAWFEAQGTRAPAQFREGGDRRTDPTVRRPA